MKNCVYKKLLEDLFRNALTLYLYQWCEKGFEIVKEKKILKFAGDGN